MKGHHLEQPEGAGRGDGAGIAARLDLDDSGDEIGIQAAAGGPALDFG